jgi:hypothetical protein
MHSDHGPGGDVVLAQVEGNPAHAHGNVGGNVDLEMSWRCGSGRGMVRRWRHLKNVETVEALEGEGGHQFVPNPRWIELQAKYCLKISKVQENVSNPFHAGRLEVDEHIVGKCNVGFEQNNGRHCPLHLHLFLIQQ